MYYALYRKYRPLTFDTVVGQDAVTETLKNQIMTSRIAHSYLFTGTRGTGKTTCAKIFARAINCENPVNGNPCNECPTCRGLLDGSNFAVTEMDAASNNGVDDVRKIIEEIVFPPLDAKYRVYIIDEVHMLSAGAFNALLKTIEEPPAHAVFILATTEIQKVPATVRSRCQRYDMSRLSKDTLISYLKGIIAAEGRKLDDEAVEIIATLGDGSARDSLSILEKVIDKSDAADVRNTLGVCDEKEFFALSEAIASRDIDGIYAVTAALYSASKEFGLLCSDLSAFYRKLLIAGTAKNPVAILDIPEKEAEVYKRESGKYTVEHIIYIMNRLRDNYALLRQSIDKRADTEVCLLRCALPELNTSSAALTARLSELEKKAETGFTAAKITPDDLPVQKPSAQAQVQVKAAEEPEQVKAAPETTAHPEPEAAYEPQQNSSQAPKTGTPEEFTAPRPDAQISGKGGYKQFIGFDDAVRELKQSDLFLSMNLQKNCKALIRDKDILLVFANTSDKNDAQANGGTEKIRKAVDNLHMQDSRIIMTVGSAEEYLGERTSDEIMKDTGLFTE